MGFLHSHLRRKVLPRCSEFGERLLCELVEPFRENGLLDFLNGAHIRDATIAAA